MEPINWRSRITHLGKEQPTQLLHNPLNWRIHPKDQQDALQTAIDTVGFVAPIIVQESRGMIIDGHLRAELAERNGAEVDVIYLDVNDDEANLLLATFDKITGMAGIDDAKFAELMESLPDTDEVRAMLDAVDVTWGAGGRVNLEEEAVDPDELPTIAEPVSNFGDIWILGKHRLFVGDARWPGAVAHLMDGDRADIMWTDPPYGVSYVGKTADALTIQNDDDPDKLRALIDEVFLIAERDALKPGSPVYVAHPAGPLSLLFGQAILDLGWRWHQTLVWVKDSMVLGRSDYHYRHEPIYLAYTPGGDGRRGRGGQTWYGPNNATSVFEIPRPKASRDHPTMKPVALVGECLENSCPPRGMVVDFFAGSGTTMLAAEMLERQSRTAELDRYYADVCVRRWEQATGGTPERINVMEELRHAAPELEELQTA